MRCAQRGNQGGRETAVGVAESKRGTPESYPDKSDMPLAVTVFVICGAVTGIRPSIITRTWHPANGSSGIFSGKLSRFPRA